MEVMMIMGKVLFLILLSLEIHMKKVFFLLDILGEVLVEVILMELYLSMIYLLKVFHEQKF